MTEEVYLHVFDSMRRDAAKKMDKILSIKL
jgi:hypothetical protein